MAPRGFSDSMARSVRVIALTLAVLINQASSHNFLTGSAANLGLGFDVLPPKESVTVLGARLYIPCRPTMTEKGLVNVTWTDKGVVVNEPTRYVLPNGTLLITKVLQEHVSQYRCVLHLGTHTVVSATLNLKLAASGRWPKWPEKTTLREGGAVRLTCYMSSLPAAELSWYKDEIPLTIRNHSRYYQPLSGVLQVTNITQEDSGNYQCKGLNPLMDQEFMSPIGQITVEQSLITLTIKEEEEEEEEENEDEFEREEFDGEEPIVSVPALPKPTLLPVPSKVEVQVGHRAVLECITDDIMNPKLLWSRIDGRRYRRQGVQIEGQATLVFQSVRESDAGVYNCSCVSSRLKKPVTQIFDLIVLKPPMVNITINPQGGHVPNGESIVRINCSASGHPAPDISWHKDGLAVPFSGRHIFDVIEQNNYIRSEQLAITNIMAKDSGIYQCIAKNRVGVASEAVLLMVNLSPEMPGIVQNIIALEKTPTTIFVKWNPPPPLPSHNQYGYVIHYLERAGSDPEMQVLTEKTSIRISNLRPYTFYSIYVRTFTIRPGHTHPLFGEPTEELIIRTSADVPTMLPELKLIALSPTVLRVNWTLLTQGQARGKVTSQVIEWRRINRSDEHSQIIDPNVNSYDIKGLHPYKEHEVRVKVKTDAGFPLEKDMPWVKIKIPRRPNSEKRLLLHLSVNSDNPTQIVVKWKMAEVLRSQVLTYVVSYFNSSGSTSQKHLNAAATSVILEDLEPNTCYSVGILPVYTNRIESDKSSQRRTICTLDISLPISIPPTDDKAKIGVKRIQLKELNTTSIQVTWRPKGKKIPPEFFTVKVINLGRQQESVAALLHVDNDIPIDPPELKGDIVHNLSSSPPPPLEEDPLDSLKDYTEDVPDVDDFKDNPVRFWRVTGRKVILDNLKPLNKYEISVWASTSMVSSVPSKPKYITTSEGVPSAPLNLSWKAATPKEVDLVWTRPAQINGNLKFYLVTYSHDLLEWKNHTVASHLTRTQIQDLISNTNYTVQISGVTGGGRGTQTTAFVYINATLVSEPEISTELVVLSVVILLAAITAVVAFICLRMVCQRRTAATTFQGNGTCRMIYANGLKPTSSDHGDELDDYRPVLTSLPPAVPNHHLDTKGGAESQGDGVVVNCLYESTIPSINQIDVPNENHVALRDCPLSNNIEDNLDDIDDDDVSSRLLQTLSVRDPECSTLTNLDPRFPCEQTQVVPRNSIKDIAGMVVEATASS